MTILTNNETGQQYEFVASSSPMMGNVVKLLPPKPEFTEGEIKSALNIALSILIDSRDCNSKVFERLRWHLEQMEAGE